MKWLASVFCKVFHHRMGHGANAGRCLRCGYVAWAPAPMPPPIVLTSARNRRPPVERVGWDGNGGAFVYQEPDLRFRESRPLDLSPSVTFTDPEDAFLRAAVTLALSLPARPGRTEETPAPSSGFSGGGGGEGGGGGASASYTTSDDTPDFSDVTGGSSTSGGDT